MFWPDTQTGVDVEPARKTVQSAVRKYFTEGGVGVPPTVPGGDWFNQITNELLNVLAAAGIEPSKADDDQLLNAIRLVSDSRVDQLRQELLGGPLTTLLSGRFALRDFVSVLDFTVQSGVVSDGSQAFQAAIDSLGDSGGHVICPPGKYVFDSPVIMRSNVIIQGFGNSSEVYTDHDIEVFNSSSDINSSIFNAEIRDLFINKSVKNETTKYDIRFTNPSMCKCIRVRVKSGHNDNDYSQTNVGGILFQKPSGSTKTAFMNKIQDCWIQNNSIFFDSITDSTIDGGYVWGHTRQFAIRLRSVGNVDVVNISGIITSQFNGGIWLDGPGINQIRIASNEWDGNPLLLRGDGIYCPQSVIGVTVYGNTIWGCGKNGASFTDPVGLIITNNTFWKNNDSDNYYDDVRIIGKSFSPQANVISSNTFVNDVARSNKGYAIREVNEGVNPANNVYTSNGVTGLNGYNLPAFNIVQSAEVYGNYGLSVQEIKHSAGRRSTYGPEAEGLQIAGSATIVAGGYIDVTVNTDTWVGSPGGFSGHLYITSCRENYSPQSSRYIFTVLAYGTTLSATQQVVQNGTGGGCTVALSMPSNGVIRITNSSAETVRLRAAFNGVKSLT